MTWQRKLGPPKADENFHELLSRARMFEEYEKQFQESAKRDGNKDKSESGKRYPPKTKPDKPGDDGGRKPEIEPKKPDEDPKNPTGPRCYYCKRQATFVGTVLRERPLERASPPIVLL